MHRSCAIVIGHASGSYPVEFESLSAAISRLPEDSIIITDSNVHGHWGGSIPDSRAVLTVEPGESSKSIATYERLLSSISQAGLTRNSTIAAFGGGVVGDVAGFVAASFMRGIKFAMIPTSLLSMVDSSVGGKVGINLPQGKNLVGAFHPPQFVSIDVDLLRTLPEREFRNGVAEVLKSCLIADREAAEDLRIRPLQVGDDRLRHTVEKCIAIKAHVVTNDEFETTGLRATLNYGHTIGHALERLLGYGRMLHGEAISIGMVYEARLGELIGKTSSGTAEFVEFLVRKHGLPTALPEGVDHEALIAAMRSDKKRTGAGLAFSLLTDVGGCKLVMDVDEAAVAEALRIG